ADRGNHWRMEFRDRGSPSFMVVFAPFLVICNSPPWPLRGRSTVEMLLTVAISAGNCTASIGPRSINRGNHGMPGYAGGYRQASIGRRSINRGNGDRELHLQRDIQLQLGRGRSTAEINCA